MPWHSPVSPTNPLSLSSRHFVYRSSAPVFPERYHTYWRVFPTDNSPFRTWLADTVSFLIISTPLVSVPSLLAFPPAFPFRSHTAVGLTLILQYFGGYFFGVRYRSSVSAPHSLLRESIKRSYEKPLGLHVISLYHLWFQSMNLYNLHSINTLLTIWGAYSSCHLVSPVLSQDLKAPQHIHGRCKNPSWCRPLCSTRQGREALSLEVKSPEFSRQF